MDSITEIWKFPLVGVPPTIFTTTITGGGGAIDFSFGDSTVTDDTGAARANRRRRRDPPPPPLPTEDDDDSLTTLLCTSSGNDAIDNEAKRAKVMNSRDENCDSKVETEASSGTCNKMIDQNAQPSEEPKQDYIHVRARRGQATDNHSLAERVIGKASVLDEIINYIQALQFQVEFLSMKLEAVNSRINPGIKGFPVPAKDFGARAYDTYSLLAGHKGI